MYKCTIWLPATEKKIRNYKKISQKFTNTRDGTPGASVLSKERRPSFPLGLRASGRSRGPGLLCAACSEAGLPDLPARAASARGLAADRAL